jgi:hypothetical protein
LSIIYERFVVKNGIKRVYICKYDWSSGSLIFKQKQSRFHDDRSLNLWQNPRNIWLHSRFLLEMSVNICLAIVLSVLLWYTDSDYPYGIFKLFLWIKDEMNYYKDTIKYFHLPGRVSSSCSTSDTRQRFLCKSTHESYC